MKRFIMIAIALGFITGSAWGQKPVDKAGILQDPEWKKIYDGYAPDAQLIENLKKKAAGLKADVYFAFWCSDSLNHVPVFLKILDAVNLPEFKVNFYEVERKAAADQKFFVEDLMIERVPTFIFFAGDLEIGRIVENPNNSLLEDIMTIVFQKDKDK